MSSTTIAQRARKLLGSQKPPTRQPPPDADARREYRITWTHDGRTFRPIISGPVAAIQTCCQLRFTGVEPVIEQRQGSEGPWVAAEWEQLTSRLRSKSRPGFPGKDYFRRCPGWLLPAGEIRR